MTTASGAPPEAPAGAAAPPAPGGAAAPPNPAPPAAPAPAAPNPPAGEATPPAGGNTPPIPPAPPTEQPAPPAPPTDFKVPDEYKDKPWASKVKSADDLWKQLANTQELVGKKSVVPDLAKATPEEREAYYAQVRPKDAKEYTFTPDYPLDPTMEAGVRELLMKNGVSATQGNEIIKGYQQYEQALAAKQFDPEGFDTSMKSTFGDNYKAVEASVRTNLKGLMSPEDFKMMDNLPNAYLGIIYKTLGNVQKAYGVKETDSAHLQSSGGHVPTDITAVRQGLRDQLAKLVLKPHTVTDKQVLIDKINATYQADPRIQR